MLFTAFKFCYTVARAAILSSKNLTIIPETL